MISQANYFWELTQDHPRHFPLVADVERHTGLGQAETARRVERVLKEIENLSGQKAIIYAGGSFWNYHVGETPWASEHLLWIARYNSRIQAPWISEDSRFRPLPWTEWTWWQKSADGNGHEFRAESPDICLDVFNGTYEDLLRLSERTMQEPSGPISDDALKRLWAYAMRQGWDM